jgi:aldehyde dehydrogenase (NAD+)
MPATHSCLIDGELVSTAGTLDVLNPANEQVVGSVPACGKDELDRAVAAARRAFQS